MWVCGARQCSRREGCKHWEGYLKGTAQYLDWSTSGWGRCYETEDGKQFSERGYDCGDLSETYPIFEPIEREK